jgi:hypothetical protein
MELRDVYSVERIELYLGIHEQVFDLIVSEDGVNWTCLKPEDFTTIYDSTGEILNDSIPVTYYD